MTRRSLGTIAGLVVLLAISIFALSGTNGSPGPRPADKRPTLALLTSLPLVFGEHFGLDGGGSPALTRLEQRYRILPIGIADKASLSSTDLLLMAHPRAQPAEVLVELDDWVRKGGRLLLLADPQLDWPSERPLGDRLRPPPAFADTGLLKRWGMTLRGPQPVGPVETSNGKQSVMTSSPGGLESRSCHLMGQGFVAHCRIGKGRVTVIADADWLDVGEDRPEKNLDVLIDELDRLESR